MTRYHDPTDAERWAASSENLVANQRGEVFDRETGQKLGDLNPARGHPIEKYEDEAAALRQFFQFPEDKHGHRR